MGRRTDLHELLKTTLGNNVYYQPPESTKMNYPCIRYELNDIISYRANNKLYKMDKCYTITLIHKDPDNTIVDALTALPKCGYDRHYKTDGLNHYVFKIFY